MRSNPERFALNVVLVAFAIFLLLCGGTIYAVQWFIFQSQVPMAVTLSVSRGTVSVVPPDTGEAIAVTDQRPDLQTGARITTDANSQGLLSFRDPSSDRLVAEWVLHHDTAITLDTALAPRFGLNTNPYVITGSVATGNTEVLILSAINRSADFTLDTEYATANFDRAGQYLVDVSAQASRITTREGTARVTGQDQSVITLEPDQLVTAIGETGDMIVENAEFDLLENEDFHLPDLAGWEVYSDGNDPQGEVSSIIFEGRPVVLLNRPLELFDGPPNHGEIGLEQALNVPTDDLSFLEVRVTFRVAEQSLSTCGIAGSECPLMVRMDYRDAADQERFWIHGFYANHNPALEYPLRCDTCPIDHERIALDRWHTFESGNLMTLLPAELKPSAITGVRLYASGHVFKVYVAEMSLRGAP